MSDPLPADLADALLAAEARLAGAVTLQYFSDVASTNDIALGLAQAGAPEGTAVLADLQRAGRGRRGRSWFSPPGAGLYLSMIVRAGTPPSSATLLTLAAGVGVAEAVSSVAGLPVELKWPNDVVIGRPWRKLGGILCESVNVGSRVDAVVVGVGINLRPAAYPPELADRATSIEIELGRPIERAPLVVECLARVIAAIHSVRDGEGDGMLREWRRIGRAALNGAAVRWQDSSGERRGVAWDIAGDGALVVESGGRIERIIAGEVLWDRTS